jgi:hypothetical protein
MKISDSNHQKNFSKMNSINKVLATEHVDFADSEYESFDMSENAILTIYMKSWQNKPLRIIFAEVIQFSYKLGDFPKDLYIGKFQTRECA